MNLETEDANLALMITPQDHSVDNVGDGEAVPMSDPVEVEQGRGPEPESPVEPLHAGS